MKLLLLIALVAAAHAVTYQLSVKTQDVDWGDSNGYFYATAMGYNGLSVDFGVLGKANYDDFERGNTDVYEFSSDVDLGKLGCLVIHAGTKSSDAWMIDSVSIKSDTDAAGFSGANSANDWMSSDTSLAGDAGKLAMMWCAPPS